MRRISSHIVDCPDYLALFDENPARALDPAAEQQRHHAEDTTDQARAQQRGRRMNVRFAEINRQQAASASRWARQPDILE